MYSIKRYTALASATIVAGTVAMAQEITKEVIIERNIEPVERAAVRPPWVSPSILTPKVEAHPLSMGEYDEMAEVNRTFSPLSPAAWGDSVWRADYRGYAAIGYFPVYNLGATAGYRFVSNSKLNAGAHLNYNGASWGGGEVYPSGKFSSNRFDVGADIAANFKKGMLSANVGYTYLGTGAPDEPAPELVPGGYALFTRGSQGASMLDADVLWKTDSYRFSYEVGAKFGYTAMANAKNYGFLTVDPMHETDFGANAGVTYRYYGEWHLGAAADMRHVRDLRYIIPTEQGEALGSWGASTLGTYTVNPSWSRRLGRHFNMRLGLRVDFNSGGWQRDTHIAPDVELRWTPSAFLAFRASATGGEVANTTAELWNDSPWTTGVFCHERSHVPVDARFDITVGQYRGMWATAHVGWAKASNWLALTSIGTNNTWAMNTIDGANYGIELGYSWKDKLVVKGHAEGAKHGCNYHWRDNAKWVLGIDASFRPIPALKVEAGYAARVDRFAYGLTSYHIGGGISVWNADRLHLGDATNLHVGADYAISSALTAFVNAENLLNHHYYLAPGVRSRGVHGAAGVSVKF